MWPAFDLVNRGVFMELGSLRLIRGVPETEGVKNGVRSEVYEKKKQKNMEKKGRNERKEKEMEEKKKKGKQ